MKTQNHYDIIVLGDHPAALLCAALLSQKEYSVLIVAPEHSLHYFKAKNGQCFDPEPQAILGVSLDPEDSALLHQVLRDLSGSSELSSKESLVIKEGILVATPQYRVNFSSLKDLDFEFKREVSPEESFQVHWIEKMRRLEEKTLEFWAQYPQLLDQSKSQGALKSFQLALTQRVFNCPRFEMSFRGFLRSQGDAVKLSSLYHELKDQSLDLDAALTGGSLDQKPIQCLWQGLFFALSSQFTGKTNFWNLCHLLLVSRGGLSWRGGLSLFREQLLEIAQKNGAHVTKTTCQSIFIKNNQLLGIQLEGSSEMILTRLGGVLGQSLHRVTSGSRRLRLRQKKRSLPVGWRFTVALTAHADAFLEGLPHRVIWKEQNSPALEIEILSQNHDSNIQDSERVIYLRVVLPYANETLKSEYLRVWGLRMINQVRNIIPFLDQHLIRQFPSLHGDEGLKDLEKIYSFGSLEDIPDSLLVYSSEKATVGGHSGIRRLWSTSPEVHSELGTFGFVVSALEVVSEVTQLRQLRNE